MVLEVGAGEFLVCYLIVVIVSEVGLGGVFVEEEGEFEGAGAVEVEGVGMGPLGGPGFLGVDGLMREGVGGDGVEVPHLVVDGLVVGSGLVDQPDFDGVIDEALFVVGNADDDGCFFVDGEVPGVSFCCSGGSEDVEFGEGLPGFW